MTSQGLPMVCWVLLVAVCWEPCLTYYLWPSETLDYSGRVGSEEYPTLEDIQQHVIDQCSRASTAIILNLSDNNVTDPTTFLDRIAEKCGTKIIHLDLSHNWLQTLPVWKSFTCLTVLNVSFNNITTLKAGALPPNLEVFDISHNKLQDIEKGAFAGLYTLVTLNASHNQISEVDSRVFHQDMHQVMHVDFSFNRITAFEPWPYYFNPLVRVNLSHNTISHFTNSANVVLTRSREMLRAKVDLTHNNLSRFSLDEISSYFGGRKPNAMEIGNLAFVLTDNPWVCDCQLYWVVNAVRSSPLREYRTVPDYLFCDTPRHLHGKNLGYLIDRPQLLVCDVTEGCPEGCECRDIPHVEYIRVDCDPSRHLYTQLPATLPPDKPLFLNLSGHQLHVLGQSHGYVSRLCGLDVSRNMLTHITSSFLAAASSLVWLNVSDNRLSTLPGNIRGLSLANTQVENNPLVCSCRFIWFGEWVRATNPAANASIPTKPSTTPPPGNGNQVSSTSDTDLQTILRYGHEFLPSSASASTSSPALAPPRKPLYCTTEDGTKLLVVDMSSSTLGCRRLTIALLVAGGCFLLATMMVMLMTWRWRYEVKVFLRYWHLGLAGCCHARFGQKRQTTNIQRDTHPSRYVTGRNYDVYVSVDEDDVEACDYVIKVLIPLLEGRQLSVYLPFRQDPVGVCKAEARADAVLGSNSALIIISRHYSQNGWCRFEFDQACRHLEQDRTAGRLVLLVIANNDSDNVNDNDSDNNDDNRQGNGTAIRNSDKNCVEELARYRESDGRMETLEPLRSFLADRHFLSLHDRFMRQKLVYELTRRRNREERNPDREV